MGETRPYRERAGVGAGARGACRHPPELAGWPDSPRVDAGSELLTSVLSLCYVPGDMMSGVETGRVRCALRSARWCASWRRHRRGSILTPEPFSGKVIAVSDRCAED